MSLPTAPLTPAAVLAHSVHRAERLFAPGGRRPEADARRPAPGARRPAPGGPPLRGPTPDARRRVRRDSAKAQRLEGLLPRPMRGPLGVLLGDWGRLVEHAAEGDESGGQTPLRGVSCAAYVLPARRGHHPEELVPELAQAAVPEDGSSGHFAVPRSVHVAFRPRVLRAGLAGLAGLGDPSAAFRI